MPSTDVVQTPRRACSHNELNLLHTVKDVTLSIAAEAACNAEGRRQTRTLEYLLYIHLRLHPDSQSHLLRLCELVLNSQPVEAYSP